MPCDTSTYMINPPQVSVHFRGPLRLKQFASYSPGSGSTKRSLHPSPHERRHNHQHLHHHAQNARRSEPENTEEKRDLGDWITATINGEVVSWLNPGAGGPAATSPTGVSSPDLGSAAAPASPAPTLNLGSGTWARQAYYDATSGVADGLVFLNNMGGQGSGTFD